jgi:TP901 family phage tail tape measure protein
VANRTVSVALKLQVGDYTTNADKAAKSTDKIGESAQKTAKAHDAGMKTIARGATVAAAVGVAGLGAMIGAAANFDKAMSGVGAVANATGAQMETLRAAALKAGADTAFSASEAADAEAELAKAGVSTSDILGGGLMGSLSLAAAGQLDLADAATISAQAMNVWQLKGSDVSHIADVLAAGANKSAADVHQLGDAMRAGGLVAAQMGVGFEDTIGTLSAFADRALIGSDAGTSLKTMLQRLAAPSNEAANMMTRLGINAYDTGGQFVGMEKFAGILHDRLGGLSEQERNTAMATIFGSDAVRAANVLYSIGAPGVKDYTTAVNDQGAAGRMAAAQMDNLSGDLEQLKGSLETALIQTGSAGTGVLRGIAQAATGAVNAFGGLPGPVQATAMGMLAAGTAGLGLLSAIGTIAPKIREARTSLEGMGRAGQLANQGIGMVGRGVAASLPLLAAASIGWEIHSRQVAEAKAHVEEMTSAIAADNGALGDNTRATVVNALEKRGSLKAAADMNISAKTLTDATMGNADAQKTLSEALRANNGDRFAVIAGYEGEKTAVDEGSAAAKRKAEAEGTAATSSTGLATATKGVSAAMKEEVSVADQVKNAIDALNGGNIDAVSAEIAYRESIVATTEAIKTNGHSTDLGTKAGRDNTSAVLSAIKAAEAHATAVATQTGSVERGNAVFRAHVAALRATLLQSGMTKAAVDRLLASYAKTPPVKKTAMQLETEAAKRKLDALQRQINAAHGKNIQLVVTSTGIDRVRRDIASINGRNVVVSVTTGYGPGHGGTQHLAGGGWLSGGVRGQDSIPLANGGLGMPGEFVVNSRSAAAYGPLLEALNANQPTAPFGARSMLPPPRSVSTVTVAAGAVQVNTGPVTRETLPDVQRAVAEGFARLRADLAAGGRR